MFPGFFSFIPCPNHKRGIRILTIVASVKIIHEVRHVVMVMQQHSLRTKSTLSFSVLLYRLTFIFQIAIADILSESV